MLADKAESLLDDPAIDLARECVYRFLSAAIADPTRPDWDRVRDPDNQALAVEAADVLREAYAQDPINLTFGESSPESLDLRPLVSELNRTREELLEQYERVFGLVAPKECPPYETEYLPPSRTFTRSQQLADIAGFYQAFGLSISSQHPDRHDHIVLELEFLAVLLAKTRIAQDAARTDPEARDRVETCAAAQQAFFRDHLCWWAPAFAAGLRRRAGVGYLFELGQVLAAWVPAERHRLAVAPPFQPLPAPGLIEQLDEEPGCASCPSTTIPGQ